MKRLYYHSMQPILSLTSASDLDHVLIREYGLQESLLIENAAKGVFMLTRDMIHGKVLVAAGPGNNGSDGLAMIPLLQEAGYSPDLLLLYDKGNEENIRRRDALRGKVRLVDSAEGYDTVYDALFGFSFHGEADERTLSVIEAINTCRTVISLDVPSASLVRATATVAFMAMKDVLYEPMLRPYAGRILLHNPGFPEKRIHEAASDMHLLSDDDSSIPPVSSWAYKNSRGHLCIVGGSDRYTGAPRLSARAAFFSGAGLVTVMTDSERVRDENPSIIISRPCDDFSPYGAAVIGPGWGDGDDSILAAAIRSGKNLVIDADALKLVPRHKFGHRAVLTPHIGEYKHLMESLSIPDGLGNPQTLASSLRELAERTESVIVLKSSVVWITDGNGILVYDGSNPSLGVAGSGDVLAGIIGALLAAGESPSDAARDGVILHQKAGRKAHEEYGFYSAEELILSVGRCR